LKEAESLGVELESVSTSEGEFWRCTNADQIAERGILERWIELEEAGSL